MYAHTHTRIHTPTHAGAHTRAQAFARARSLHLVHILLRYVVYPGREYLLFVYVARLCVCINIFFLYDLLPGLKGFLW